MEKIDRLVWATGVSFTAFGTRLGVRVSDPAVVEQLLERLPPGWSPSPEPVVEGLYSLVVGGEGPRPGVRRYHLVYANAAQLARTLDLDVALDRLESHMQWVVACNSTQNLFVHAGVVGWHGQAIVMPGRSFSGKSSLVAALLTAGATYYSDEYAVFDQQGRVWPYPRLVSLRQHEGGARHRCPPEELGANVGQGPLPVGLVLVSEYRLGARWLPHSISPGHALLALLNNTVVARDQPEYALRTLHKVVTRAKAIKSQRDEAEAVIPALFKQLEESIY